MLLSPDMEQVKYLIGTNRYSQDCMRSIYIIKRGCPQKFYNTFKFYNACYGNGHDFMIDEDKYNPDDFLTYEEMIAGGKKK